MHYALLAVLATKEVHVLAYYTYCSKTIFFCSYIFSRCRLYDHK